MPRIITLLIILLVVLSLSKYSTPVLRNNSFLLTDDEVIIIFANAEEDHYLLLLTETAAVVIILNYNNKTNLEKVLKRFALEGAPVLILTNNKELPQETGRVIISNEFELEDVEIERNEHLLQIKTDDLNFCLTLGAETKLSNCNLIYYYKINMVTLNDLNRSTYGIFYRYNNILPKFFLEETYERWIDTYIVRDDEYLILKLDDDDYDVLTIPKT